MDECIVIFGVPKRLRSDRGNHFEIEVCAEICAKAGIEHKLGSPERPESQVQV